jgi:hypothetical protein
MNEAVKKIVGLERQVLWRRRLLSLSRCSVLAVTTGSLVAAGLILIARLMPIAASSWALVSVAMGLSIGVALTRWFFTRARGGDAAFQIDASLNLDDRIATSLLIINRGGPKRAFEEALLEDAAARLGSQRAASVVPFRTPRWYSLSLVSMAALAASLTISPRSLPITEAFAAERADIESAGERLEQTAAEVEQAMPAGTETAALAREQAEIGRGFRRSPATRAEALRRLSSLEERIRGRHDDLTSTHADEIVSLADRRLGDALSKLTATRRKKIEQGENQPGEAEALDEAVKPQSNNETHTAPATDVPESFASSQKRDGPPAAANSRARARTKASDPRGIANATAKPPIKPETQNRPQEPVSGREGQKLDSLRGDSKKPDPQLAKGSADQPDDSNERGPKPAETKSDVGKPGDQDAAQRRADDQQPGIKPTEALDALRSIPNSFAKQAVETLPKMSEELLKKAAELRANELSPADIEKLRKAAESLSRDLAQIAQSKELQQALQEMARQVRPEQIEQVARELGNQEQLKQELEAAARLLSENQQAKEMVAGLAGQLSRLQNQKRQNEKDQRGGSKPNAPDEGYGARDQASGSYRASRGAPDRMDTNVDRRLRGQGREASLKGKIEQRSGGEYLYLQSKAAVGAARAPYSSAYPQYRREAESSVQRSQVPPNLRSVVRKYFDAINPDAKK